MKIVGMKELDAALARLPVNIQAGARRAVEGETDEVKDDLQRAAPVLTGNLRDTIRTRLAKKTLSGTVAITAKYAEFVIHGTEDTPANDFVTPVVELTRRRFPDRLRAEVRASISRRGGA
ncbi:MAG: HK97 gp10 family phage protein [Actinoplanes sp.]